MEQLWSLFLAVISGVIASFIFLLVLRALRPKFEISKVIAMGEQEGDRSYEIKIVNLSKREAVDLRAELLLVNTEKTHDGVIQNYEKLHLTRDSLFVVPGYRKSDKDGRYAIRFTISDNLEDKWSEDWKQSIVFRIYCHDETSGFGKVFTQTYRTRKGCLQDGEFNFGKSLVVKKVEKIT